MSSKTAAARLLVAVFFCCAALSDSSAQAFLSRRLDFEVRDQPVGEALLALSKSAETAIGFSENVFEKGQRVSISAKNEPFSVILDRLLDGSGVGWREAGGQIILYRKPPPERIFSGFVEDAQSGERLVGALIFDRRSGRSARTNGYGFFSLRLPFSPPPRLFAAMLGFQMVEIALEKKAEKTLVVPLEPLPDLPEIVVSSESAAGGLRPIFSKNEENLARLPLERLPTLAGEADLMRGAAGLLPGIESSIDGLGGWSVRGGDVDQNLVVVDDAVVFSPAHGMGLFSVFNSDIVRSAQLWKGDAPARLGGRAASALEVRTREGNLFRPSASASANWLAARATVEAPLKKESGSALVSFRKSLVGPIFRSLSREATDSESEKTERASDFGFSDFYAKTNWIFGQKDRVYASFYSSRDRFEEDIKADIWLSQPSPVDPGLKFLIQGKSRFGWQNQFAALRWNRLFSEKCFANTTLTASRFDLVSTVWQQATFMGQTFGSPSGATSQTRLRDLTAKTDVDFFPSEKMAVRGGFQVSQTRALPFFYQNDGSPSGVDWVEIDSTTGLPSAGSALAFEKGLTVAAHGELEQSLGRTARLRAGFRIEIFSNAGKTFLLPQPRFLIEKRLKKGFSTWFSASEMAQTLRSVSPQVIESTADVWLLAADGMPPQRTAQAVAGLGWERGGWSARAEFFAKKMRGVEEYSLDWQLIDTLFIGGPEETILFEDGVRQWKNEVSLGLGRAAGAEFLVEKKAGATTGLVSLTVSRSERKFENLNAGRWFSARFDRPARLKTAVLHRFGERFSVSAAWQWAAGDAVSSLLLQSQFGQTRLLDLHQGLLQPERLGYGDLRQPAQHRLDVSAVFEWKKGRLAQSVALGFYNVYARRNRYFTFLTTDQTTFLTVEKGVNGLPFLPTLSWSARF